MQNLNPKISHKELVGRINWQKIKMHEFNRLPEGNQAIGYNGTAQRKKHQRMKPETYSITFVITKTLLKN